VQNTDEQAQGNNFRKNLLEVEYSLEGTIRTDVIFRVSSLDADKVRGYAIRTVLLQSFANALDIPVRQRITDIATPVTMP
jgi:hypothetical protein